MKKIQPTLEQRNQLIIPTREEFHRQWAGELSLADFNTSYPNPYRLNSQMSAFRFNERMKKQLLKEE